MRCGSTYGVCNFGKLVDVHTNLVHFLIHCFQISGICIDNHAINCHLTQIHAHVGSEENYLFLEENGQLAYIKPQNYEILKTRKYRQDIGRMENMKYDEKADCYYCKNGQVLTVQYEKREKTASGYRRIVTVYRSSGCGGCPFKTDCIKGNNCKTPMRIGRKYCIFRKR